MSVKRFNPSHPAVIGAVVLGLALVIVLNVRTFAAKRGNRDARPTVTVTPDGSNALVYLSKVINAGVEETPGTQPDSEAFAWSPQTRDPFQVFTSRSAPRKSGSTRHTATIAGGPARCDAVFLQRSDPVALIDGRSRRIGDVINGAEIFLIDTLGVSLRKGEDVIRLAVSAKPTTDATFVVVMGDRRTIDKNPELKVTTKTTEGNNEKHTN